MVKRLIDNRQRARLRLDALIREETERVAFERLEARGAVQRGPDGRITIKVDPATKEAGDGKHGI
jgi:hypothetical protein